MVTTMGHLMDTSHKEGLAAIMALLAIQVMVVPLHAASLLLYLIIISKLILSIVMIKTFVSLLIEYMDIEELRDNQTYKFFGPIPSSFLRHTSVQSRFVWTVVVEKGKTSVESNYSRIHLYNSNLKNKTIDLNNTNSSKRLMNHKIITIIDDNFPPTLHRVLQYFS